MVSTMLLDTYTYLSRATSYCKYARAWYTFSNRGCCNLRFCKFWAEKSTPVCVCTRTTYGRRGHRIFLGSKNRHRANKAGDKEAKRRSLPISQNVLFCRPQSKCMQKIEMTIAAYALPNLTKRTHDSNHYEFIIYKILALFSIIKSLY